MKALTIRSLKTILVASAMFLATVTAAAQQEVSPDHYEGPGAGPAKAHVTKVRKPTTGARKQTAKQVASNKKPATTDAAGK